MDLSAEVILDKLFDYFGVAGNIELAEKMNTTRQTITNWKKRNSINPIKKKCRELGIYRDIFGDQNIQYNEFSHASISGDGAAGVDNSKKKTITPKEPDLPLSTHIPDFVLEDLEILFKRCKGKSEEKKELIDAIDNLIFDFRKKCR